MSVTAITGSPYALGAAIRDVRERRQVSGRELTHRMGLVAASRTGQLESGRYQPQLSTLVRISAALDVPITLWISAYLGAGVPRRLPDPPPRPAPAEVIHGLGARALGQALLVVRECRNLKRVDLAHRTGMHPHYIDDLERGAIPGPRIGTLATVATGLAPTRRARDRLLQALAARYAGEATTLPVELLDALSHAPR